MLIAEELLLIGLDDESGGDETGWGTLDPGLGGALLLDLSLAEAIAVEDGRILATGDADDPLLGDALREIRASRRPRDAKHWVSRLPKALKPLRERVAERLVAEGALRREERRFLGLIPRTRYVTADPAPEAALRERLRRVLVDGVEPDARTALLVSLLVPLDLVKRVVERDERRAAKRRAKEIADRGVVGTGLDRVVQDLQAAVIVSIAAATTASTTASGS